MIFIKIHERIHERAQTPCIAALCDEKLIGKIIDDGKIYLDLDRFRNFYIGEKVSPAKAKQILADGIASGKFGSLNLVGTESVKAAVSAELLDKKEISYANGIPYIQIYAL